ncbi:hypothetical protein ACUNV4_00055 [Granulosicoccus sp. 3-233]
MKRPAFDARGKSVASSFFQMAQAPLRYAANQGRSGFGVETNTDTPTRHQALLLKPLLCHCLT